MINVIWLILIMSGIAVAALNGNPQVVTDSALQAAQLAVKFSFELIGLMAFWLGIMKLAEESGLVDIFARIISPLTRLLFPSIPKNHPAMGSILLNLSANILGLGNAATPFGLKAMQELNSLNNNSDVASDAMCTFLAINTACITLLPATVIGLRLAAGSSNPTEIVGTTIFATAIGMSLAIVADLILRPLSRKERRE